MLNLNVKEFKVPKHEGVITRAVFNCGCEYNITTRIDPFFGVLDSGGGPCLGQHFKDIREVFKLEIIQ